MGGCNRRCWSRRGHQRRRTDDGRAPIAIASPNEIVGNIPTTSNKCPRVQIRRIGDPPCHFRAPIVPRITTSGQHANEYLVVGGVLYPVPVDPRHEFSPATPDINSPDPSRRRGGARPPGNVGSGCSGRNKLRRQDSRGRGNRSRRNLDKRCSGCCADGDRYRRRAVVRRVRLPGDSLHARPVVVRARTARRGQPDGLGAPSDGSSRKTRSVSTSVSPVVMVASAER